MDADRYRYQMLTRLGLEYQARLPVTDENQVRLGLVYQARVPVPDADQARVSISG